MNDELLFERLASHDGPAALDTAFEDRLYSILQGELHRRRFLRPALLLAATLMLVLTITAAIAVGSGLIRLPWVDRLSIPLPSQAPSTDPGPPRSTGVWIATGTMGTPRYGHTAVRLLDGQVLIAGGSGGQGGFNPKFDLTSADLYDPDTGTWSATGSMVQPHDGFPATLLRDGKVLVGDVAGAEVYDPATGAWSVTGRMVGPEFVGDTATLLRDGKVLVAGLDGAQLYDPGSGNWTATGKMVTPRYNHTATLLPDGRVLVAGGDVPPDLATDSAELYDPQTGSWTAIANMRATGNTRFDSITATLLQDGTVLVVRPTSAALYDPATGTWTATGEMARPGTRYQTATLLSDGTVLVAGGGNRSDVAELYDPTAGSWITTGTMLRGHNPSSTTLLLDGTVLVAGGADCSPDASGCPTGATGSAELYIPRGLSPPPDLAPVPSPTPSPTPTPVPTPFPPEAGPVPAGARSWKVTVVNKSSEPATLFLAEEGENGIGQLCGSVTPDAVPAGVTEQVTFLLPPEKVTSCWIWINPVPGQGGPLFQTSDAPLAGEIFIQEGGQGGWLSP